MMNKQEYPKTLYKDSDTYDPELRWGKPGLFKKLYPDFQEADMKIANSPDEERFLRELGYYER